MNEQKPVRIGSAEAGLRDGAGSQAWRVDWVPLAAVVFLLALHLSMVFQRAVSWDEFLHYSLIEAFARGESVQPLQTIYVRAFAWVTYLPGNEIDHLVLIRIFMLLCLSVVSASIVGIVGKLSSRSAGLICAACYLSAGYVLQHGTALRTDVMSAALLSIALWMAVSSRWSWKAILLIGLAVGLATLVTIKTVLWLPAFIGVGLIRWQAEGWRLNFAVRCSLSALVATFVFVLFFWFHTQGASSNSEAAATSIASRSANTMFIPFYTEKFGYFFIWMVTALPFAVLAMIVPFALVKGRYDLGVRLGVLAMWSSLFVTFVYVNSYPYLYTFTLVPAAIAIFVAIDVAKKRYPLHAIAIVLAATGSLNWAFDERGVIQNQRDLLDTVKETVPGPITYFGCCATIGSWTSGNGFRTRWGVQQYLADGRPAYRDRLLSEPVPMLLANDELIGQAYQRLFEGQPVSAFLPEDAAALRETYIHFWGPVYLAGVDLRPSEERRWEALVPGVYTIEGEVLINDQKYTSGQTLRIERGNWLLVEARGRPARMIWGTGLRTPTSDAPAQLWTHF